ncbi:MAG: universal stress protein [Burkholderiales bacterium]|jgi:nucleotide-binding universal stress UspA family protein|nr:universal stress protein [Burkholderiales bacterium]
MTVARDAMRIVMAYDGSDAGLDALFAAPELAWLPRAPTDLLAVLPMPVTLFLAEGFVPGESIDADRDAARARLLAGTAHLDAHGFTAAGHLVTGEPVDEISRHARTVAASLVLVAHPRAASFAARWWRGWVGSSLLEQTPCTLLVSVY